MGSTVTTSRTDANDGGRRSWAGGWLAVAAVVVLGTGALVASLLTARDVVLAIGGLTAVLLPAIALAWAGRRTASVEWMDVVPAAALGIGIVVLLGLGLNLLPFGLNRWSWLLSGVLMLIAAWGLNRGRSPGLPSLSRPIGLTASGWVMLGAAAMLAAGALTIARLGVVTPAEAFTQLWIGPGSDTANTVQVGVQNDEGETTEYRLDVLVDGTLVGSWSPIRLGPGERWTAEAAITVPADEELEARLYRTAQPDELYRRVALRGPVQAPTEAPGAAAVPPGGTP
jgi:hypothetical protein